MLKDRIRDRVPKAYVFFVTLIMPLIAVKTAFLSRLSGYVFASPSEYASDSFLLVRTLLFAALSAVVFFVIVYKIRIGFTSILFLVLPVISLILSHDRVISLAGCDEQFEGIFVLASYAVAYFAARSMEDGELIEKLLRLSLTESSIVVILQGIVMGGKAFGTLYNSNCAGFFLALLLPQAYHRCLSLFSKKGAFSIKDRVGDFVPAVLGTVALIMTGARSAIVVSLIVLAALVAERILKGAGKALAVSGLCTVGLLLYLGLSFAGIDPGAALGSEKADGGVTSPPVTDVRTEKDCVVFERDGGSIFLSFEMPDEDHFFFEAENEKGDSLSYDENSEGTMYELKEKGYEDFSFTIADYGSFKGFLVYTGERTWYFYRDPVDGEYYYLNGYTRPEKFIIAPSFGFKGREGFASNRGYIWSRALGVLLSGNVIRLLFGTGPDTFATVFPQNDVNKYLLTDIPYKMIITRPHSLYLQAAIQLGLPFALLLTVLSCLCVIRCARSGRIWLCMSLASFLLCALFYDSTPVVTPIMAVIAGLAMRPENGKA